MELTVEGKACLIPSLLTQAAKAHMSISKSTFLLA